MRRLIALLLMSTSLAVVAAQPANLAQHWQAYNKSSTAVIHHAAFTDFLQKYVVVRDDAPNLVRYADVSRADRKALRTYIDTLTRIHLQDYNRDQQLAYWINLYNAALINLVLEHYPVETVMDIDRDGAGPWARPVVTIDSIPLSLDDIRNKILPGLWHNSIVLYGLSWAALGGPELRASAYTGDGIYQQLRDSAHRFVNSPQGLIIRDGKLTVSRFFDWYRKAFGRTTIALISQLREHAAPALSARLDIFDEINGYKFDWRLNFAD